MPHSSREQATSAYVVSTTHALVRSAHPEVAGRAHPAIEHNPARCHSVTNDVLRDIHDRRLETFEVCPARVGNRRSLEMTIICRNDSE